MPVLLCVFSEMRRNFGNHDETLEIYLCVHQNRVGSTTSVFICSYVFACIFGATNGRWVCCQQISVGIFGLLCYSADAAGNMGEDVWSLVSRQLNSRNTDAGRKQKDETKEEVDGERKAPGGEENPSNADGSEAAAAVSAEPCAFTSFALCVGMPGAGKSTLLNAYLNPSNDSIPKPTVALEYMFARRASAANMPKVRKYRELRLR